MLSNCRLYLLFTPELCRLEPWATLATALHHGVDLVQWRSKTPDRAGFERTRAVCRSHRVPLVVNDDVPLAVQSHAAGAHVGQDDLPAPAARRLLAHGWLGVSTHNVAQIDAAAAAGADYVGFGPCFPTATKGYTDGQPLPVIAAAVAAAQRHQLPLFAIGGITPARVAVLRGAGVTRIAVSSAILAAEDVAEATARLRAALG